MFGGRFRINFGLALTIQSNHMPAAYRKQLAGKYAKDTGRLGNMSVRARKMLSYIESYITRHTIILNHPQGWDGKPTGLPETAGSPKYLNDMATRFLSPLVAHQRAAQPKGVGS